MTPPPAKHRYSRSEAIPVARELVRALDPHCERLIVAGSLRRRKEAVGDVEILYVSRTAEGPPLDLFSGPSVVASGEVEIARLLDAGVIARRPLSAGRTAWGAKNKLAVHVATGMPVDLFAATEASWWSLLVCRTGGAASNTRIASEAQAKGYRWNPYGEGFTHLGSGRVVPIESERHAFEFLGLKYLEPWERE